MSLPVIRSLGRAGVKVIAAEREQTAINAALGFYSKYIADTERYPAAVTDECGFLNALRRYAENFDVKPVILPVGMDSMLALCRNRDEVSSWANIAVPDISDITLANDKGALIPFAQRQGIPCPDTTTLHEGEDIEALADRIKYPVVIKLRDGELLGLDPQNRYKIVNDRAEFIESFAQMHKISAFPLVQEYVPGEGWGVSAVFDREHNPISVFCHRRVREYPVSGGPSCFCVSVWNEELVGYAVKLLRALNWTGVAMVEFKGSLDIGFKLMEINPRFWGSLALSCAAGCDIPLALYRTACGEVSHGDELIPHYKINKKMRFLIQDLLSFFGYLRIKSNKAGFIGGFLLDLLNPTVADGVLSWRDMRASIRYFIQALGKGDRVIR